MNDDDDSKNPEEPLSDSSDIRLIQQAADGDDGAYQDLFDRFRDHLKRYVDMRMDSRLRQRVDPSDVIQETQIAAHRRLGDFLERRPMPFRIWLRKMAHEQMLNLRKMHVRSQRRSLRREVAVPERSSMLLAGQFVDGGLSPSTQMIKKEQQMAVATMLNLLADADREVLLMRFIEGLSYAEIGYSLEIDAAAARKRSSRALRRMRERIKEAGLGDTS
jgi:RNA polymerase sigma-70 factor (ECF subfamily)